MRLKIIEENFTKDFNWLFKLLHQQGQDSYIMHKMFYKNHHLDSPLTKNSLVTYFKGNWISGRKRLCIRPSKYIFV